MKSLTLRLIFLLFTMAAHAEVDGIHLTDANHTAALIDTDETEFFLSQTLDLSGRLYVGCREALFVYEPTADGGFSERRELYRFPKDSWLYDLEPDGNDLLVLTNTALYRLPGALAKNATDLQPEKLLWGNPLGHHHQGLHGMEFAPNGDLLICMGDPHPGVHLDKTRPDHLWLWTWYVGPEKREVPYAGVGAVLRLNLDSYVLSVYASGLRNPCGISFDRDWNLFANDNDQEGSTATPGRLVSVPPHSWNAWARGWDASRNPARRDMIPSVNRTLDVPVGQGYYDHTSLGKDYQGSLFVANWGGRNVSSYPIQPDVAGFQSKALPFLQAAGDRRPVSATPTNDGRLIVSLCYMTGNQPSPVCQTDLLLISPREPKAKLSDDHSDRSLIDLLSESTQVRAIAHREILRQGGSLLEEAGIAFRGTRPDSPAFSSLIFLAAAHGDDGSVARITALAQGEGRAASLAWRAAAAWPEKFPGLSDEVINAAAAKKDDPRLLMGLLEFLHSTKRSIPDSVAVLAAHRDAFARQSAAVLLARHASDAQLAALAEGTTDQRLAATLATVFKIWQRAETVSQLPEAGTVAVEKMMKLLHPEGPIDLRDLGKPIGTFRMRDWWRGAEGGKANQVEFDRLQKALADADKTIANTAATGLFFLKDDRVDARVVAVLGNSDIALSMASGQATKAELKKALLALKGAKLSTDTEIPTAFRNIDWDAKTAPQGDLAKGKELFTQRGCVACHLAPDTGAGGAIGPTLVGVGERFPPSYLAASILVPNLTVSPNFHPNTVTMKDGTVHTGFVEPGAKPGIINLRGITGQTTTLEKSNIAKQEASEQSMMPAGLVQKPEEMADLIAYMMVQPKKRNLKKGRKKKKNTKTPAAPKPAAASPTSTKPAVLKEVLSDWETAGNWQVDEEGVFVLTPRPGEVDWKRYGHYLWSTQTYRDFEISFDYKHEPGGNSGLYFNVTDRQKAVGAVIEVQIKDSAGVKKLDAHGISGGILPGVAARANSAKPAGEWNRMVVRSLNGVVSVRLNGELVNHVRLTYPKLKGKPKEGFIGFQDHGLPFWLRNIRVRSLSAASAPKDKAKSKVREPESAANNGDGPSGPNLFLRPGVLRCIQPLSSHQ